MANQNLGGSSGKVASNSARPADKSGGPNASETHETHSAPPNDGRHAKSTADTTSTPESIPPPDRAAAEAYSASAVSSDVIGRWGVVRSIRRSELTTAATRAIPAAR